MDPIHISCTMCEEEYSDDHPPRTLTCGHSLCGQCLHLIFTKDKKCPECHSSFKVSKEEDIPVSHSLLMVAKSFRSSQEQQQRNGDTPVIGKKSHQAGECETHGSLRFFRCQTCSVWVCRDCLVVDHPESPKGNCRIVSISDSLEEEKETHRKNTQLAISNVWLLKTKLESLKSQLSAKELEQQSMIDKLTASTDKIKKKSSEVKEHIEKLETLPTLLEETQIRIADAKTPWDMTVATQTSSISLASIKQVFKEVETFQSATELEIRTSLFAANNAFFPFPYPNNTTVFKNQAAPLFRQPPSSSPFKGFSFGGSSGFGSVNQGLPASSGGGLFGSCAPSFGQAMPPGTENSATFGGQSTSCFGQTASSAAGTTTFGSSSTRSFGQAAPSAGNSPFGSQSGSSPFGQNGSPTVGLFAGKPTSSIGQAAPAAENSPFGSQPTGSSTTEAFWK